MRRITIQGLEFEVNNRYEAGHVLNEAEAKQLSQTYIEALRNNFAAKIKKFLTEKEEKALALLNEGKDKEEQLSELPEPVGFTEDEVETLQADFLKYATEFEFANRTGARAMVDPVEREAFKIARTTLKAYFNSKNIDPKTISDEKMDALLTQIAAKPDVRALAQKRVDDMRSVGDDLFSNLEV
jgi:seryl-tRNA synthetase